MADESEDSPKKKPKKFNKKTILIISVVLLFVAAVAYGSLFSMKSINSLTKQRDDLRSEVGGLQKTAKKLEAQSQDLATNLKAANDELQKIYDERKEAESAVLTLNVSSATRDSRGYVHQTNNNVQDIIVEMTVKNESETELYFSLDNLKLKDSQNQTYNPLNSSCWPLGVTKVFLKSQLLAPGESASGSICFVGISTFVSGLKLQYGEKTFDITPKDATYPSWW